MGLEPASSVCAFVRAFTLSNMNISETSWPIAIKFYLNHHWDGGKAALVFDADQIRTLVFIVVALWLFLVFNLIITDSIWITSFIRNICK